MPKPDSIYFEDDQVTLYQGDCLEVLDGLDQKSVDLIFADPPYNLSNGGFTCHAGRMVKVDKGHWDKSHGHANDVQFIEEWLSRCQRVLRDSGTIWVTGTHHVIFNVGYVMQKLGFHILNMVTWYKPNASPNLSCRFFTHSTEIAIWAAPSRSAKLRHAFNYDEMRARNSGKQMRDVWTFDEYQNRIVPAVFMESPPGRDEKTHGRHPTQKPIALLNRIVSASSKEGDVVLDPFCGSGTTGVVSVALGRHFVGIDMDEAYLRLTLRRIESVLNEPEQLELVKASDQPLKSRPR